LPYVWFAQLIPERWHLAFDSGGNHLTNASIAPVEIMQIGPFAARIVSMAMRAIHHEHMPALRCVGCQFRRLCRSLSAGRKRNRLDYISRCAQIDSNRVHFF
jgi:hypothetical protein